MTVKEQHLHHIMLKSKFPSLQDVHFQNYLASVSKGEAN